MKSTLKMVALALMIAGLAACASKKPMEEPTPVEPMEKPMEKPEVDPAPDPRDFTDERNLDNQASLLSKRVVYFDFDQSTIRSEYRDIVNAHAQFLASKRNYAVTLEGHADERGTREYNLGLGERRSNAVGDVLEARGASSGQVGTVSYGEERPVSTCSEERCWEKNRRVEIVYTKN